MSDTQSLKDELAWTEYNLAMANAEVKKGREIIEYIQKTIDTMLAIEAVPLIEKRLEEFYASYID